MLFKTKPQDVKNDVLQIPAEMIDLRVSWFMKAQTNFVLGNRHK